MMVPGANSNLSNNGLLWLKFTKKLLAIELGFAGVYFTHHREKPSIICDRLKDLNIRQ